MPPQKRALLTAVFFVAALALAGCGLGRDPGRSNGAGVRDPMVAATVNGRPIYTEDVRARAVSRGWIQETEDLDGDSPAAVRALDELIEMRLFAMEAEARGLDRQPDISRRLEYAREVVLADAIYTDLAEQATDAERIERLYRDNQHRLGEGDEVHLRHIQFPTQEAADAAKRRLDQGERFEALAFELSVERDTAPDGGDMGFAPLSDLIAPLRQEVERTTVGTLIGPIQLQETWHIFRLDDRRARGGPSLEELRPRITQWLAWQDSRQLRERLERDARIDLHEDDEDLQPGDASGAPADAAPTRPQPAPTAPEGPLADAPPPFPFPQQAPPPQPRAPAAGAGGSQ